MRHNNCYKKIFWQTRLFKIILISLIILIASIAFFTFYNRVPEIEVSEDIAVENVEPTIRLVKYVVEAGDTLDGIFSKVGVEKNQGYELILAFRKVWDVKKSQIGDKIQFGFDHGNDLVYFQYELSVVDIFEAKLENGQYEFTKLNIPVEKRVSKVSVELDSSLYNAFLKKGETPQLIEKFVDLYAWDIDFYSDPRKGDKVALLVEKLFVDDRFYRYGQILIADYDGKIIDTTGVYFQSESGEKGYFDSKGRSLARNFLKTPVKFTRISSKFGMRRHPVTHRHKAHLGTDYAAPTGAPVWAMADGVIVKKAYGRANGNYIAIRHKKNYETYYLHLSRFHPGTRVGKRVKQKELIGYVGSTGLSTGPHLHLGVKRAGKFINPLKLKKVKEIQLRGKDLDQFKGLFELRLAELEGRDDVLISTPDSLLLNEDVID